MATVAERPAGRCRLRRANPTGLRIEGDYRRLGWLASRRHCERSEAS
jgi:hypothetical protein